jgi:hypothetical protein
MRMRICSLASTGSGAFLGAGVFWEVTIIKFTGTSRTRLSGTRCAAAAAGIPLRDGA